MDGLFLLNKPKGCPSRYAANRAIGRLGKVRIGHVGTLDPLADGVLPIVIGRATKLQDYLLEWPKSYEFEVRFGVTTPSLDLETEISQTDPTFQLEAETLHRILPEFWGRQVQVPPVYSAVKVLGTPLYRKARKEQAIGKLTEQAGELKRSVHIHELDVIELEGNQAKLKMVCSKGTYVRSVARDLGTRMGTFATVTSLKRTSSSGYELEECVASELCETSEFRLSEHIIPLDKIRVPLPRWQPQIKSECRSLLNGQKLLVDANCFVKTVEGFSMDPAEDFELLLVSEGLEYLGIVSATRVNQSNYQLHLKRGI